MIFLCLHHFLSAALRKVLASMVSSLKHSKRSFFQSTFTRLLFKPASLYLIVLFTLMHSYLSWGNLSLHFSFLNSLLRSWLHVSLVSKLRLYLLLPLLYLCFLMKQYKRVTICTLMLSFSLACSNQLHPDNLLFLALLTSPS